MLSFIALDSSSKRILKLVNICRMKSACNGNETACGERLLISDIDGSEEEKYPEEKKSIQDKGEK